MYILATDFIYFLCCCWRPVAQLCTNLCDSLDCNTPDFPVLHHFLELAQTHAHWVGDAIQPSHSVIPFSSCLQSFPASGSFLMSQLFTSGGQSIGASASVLPKNIKDWFPLGLTGLIPLMSKGLSRVFSRNFFINFNKYLLNVCCVSFCYKLRGYCKKQNKQKLLLWWRVHSNREQTDNK